jgi:NAD(P)H dehydrogenase (quinone)
MSSPIYLITGASGKLGSKVVAQLLAHGVKPESIAVLVRSEQKGQDYKAKGLNVRIGSYDDSESLKQAVKGIKKALLISSSEPEKDRVKQHENFIQAAKEESIEFIAYTSHLYADTSPASLAIDHKATEELIAESAIPYSFLRNGWYIENVAAQIDVWSKTGVIPGAGGQGRISGAAINDYAEAAAKVLLAKEPPKRVYELGGSPGYTLDELAALASDVLGKPIKAVHVSKAEYEKMLASFGLPSKLVEAIADAEDNASRGSLYDTTGDLQSLIGRPAEPIKQVMQAFM